MVNWLVGLAMTGAALAIPAYAQSSRDSSGIAIVENSRPIWSDGDRLALSNEPRLAIGAVDDSAYLFRQVRGVMLLSDGRIAVADGGSGQLRLFNAEGRFLSAGAGTAGGSGQIRDMQWARRLPGDTIVIASGIATTTLYSDKGEFVRTARLPSRTGAAAMARPLLLLTLLNGGRKVVSPLPNTASRTLGVRWADSVSLQLVSEAGDLLRELGSFPYITLEQVSSGPEQVWLSATGVFAGDEKFYFGFGDRYEIRVYAEDGELQSIIRRSWAPTPISDDDWEYWVVEWSKLWVSTTGAEREKEVQEVRDSPWAEANPAFSQFIVDRGGRLWVREAHWQDAIAAGSLTDRPAVPSSWSVFDPAGRWLGDIGMPTGFQPFEIGADYVTGTLRTGSVNQVVIYDLRAPGR